MEVMALISVNNPLSLQLKMIIHSGEMIRITDCPVRGYLQLIIANF